MQYTSNFNFNLPEGTDLWNYLTQTNPNFTALDSILKGIQDGTVTTATEVTSGTAHAITRTLPDVNVIRYTATGRWELGDTMTIDGTPVTVVKPNGSSLQSGDYIIGSEVLGILRATQFTVYVGGASSLDASDVTYDNTVSRLTATDAQAAIDENAGNIATNTSNITTINNTLANLGNLENNVTSGVVNLSNVTLPYLLQYPGYIVVGSGNPAGSLASFNLVDANGTSLSSSTIRTVTANSPLSNQVFVTKGLKVSYVSTSNGGAVYYYPLDSKI